MINFQSQYIIQYIISKYSVFAKYPVSIKDFFKSSMPPGYSQERTIEFDNDGTYTTKAMATFENGCVYNRVTLTGENFQEDGHILKKNYAFNNQSSVVYFVANKSINGVRGNFNKVCFLLNQRRYVIF